MHHPPNWLVEYETPDFGRGLEQDFKFLLHGHGHRGWVKRVVRPVTARDIAFGEAIELARSHELRGAARWCSEIRGAAGESPGTFSGRSDGGS